ncbi:MAG: hypothetical protein P4L43_04885 [Syntrophobacteraceae bacterium]|nr:hypothetical protein [Syntrophobacteraceae bacterium]
MKLAYQLHGMRYSDDQSARQTFKNMDLTQFLGKMPLNTWKELVADQTAVRRGDDGAMAKNVSMTHALSLTKRFFIQAGYRPDSTFKDDADKYNGAVGKLTAAIDNWRTNNSNKVPTDADILQIGQSTLLPQQGQGNPANGTAAPPSSAMIGHNKDIGTQATTQAPATLKRGDVLTDPNGVSRMKGEDGLWRPMPNL